MRSTGRESQCTGRRVRAALVLCALLLPLALGVAAMDMDDDMPSDPVSGEMVMSTAFNVNLRNGQRLRFATQETLDAFVHDPSLGLGEVTSVALSSGEGKSSARLCPVCGMQTSAKGGPQVLMRHGEQSIHTCSIYHAHQVHDGILSFREAPSNPDAAAPEHPANDPWEQSKGAFCVGTGTTMLNGFSIFDGGRDEGPNACLVLWFPGWILNTRWRYALGCAVVILSAMFNEYLLRVRRLLRKESNRRCLLAQSASNAATPLSASEVTKLLHPATLNGSTSRAKTWIPQWFRGLSSEKQHLMHSILHGVTIFVAYMLMLVAMTYDGTLFGCCIVGYVIGYYCFGERREAVPEIEEWNMHAT